MEKRKPLAVDLDGLFAYRGHVHLGGFCVFEHGSGVLGGLLKMMIWVMKGSTLGKEGCMK